MIEVVSTALRSAIVASSAVAALVSTRVYNTIAPQNAALPYIVFTYVSGGSTNDTPRDALNVVYQVVATSQDPAQAQQIEKLVRAALHNATLTMSDGWLCWDCQHEDVFYLVEYVDQRPYYHAGGEYRVRAAKG